MKTENTTTARTHTPGPWSWDGEPWNGDENYRKDAAPWLIGAGEKVVIKGDVFCSEKNARLIAAAPELLALAERVARLNESAGEIGDGMLVQLVTEARAAIAKAKGAK